MRSTNEVTRRVINHMQTTRRVRGWSRDEMARLIAESKSDFGWGRHRLHNLEARAETAQLTIDEAVALADFLGLSLTELVQVATQECPRCKGQPPPGFDCRTCGAGVD